MIMIIIFKMDPLEQRFASVEQAHEQETIKGQFLDEV